MSKRAHRLAALILLMLMGSGCGMKTDDRLETPTISDFKVQSSKVTPPNLSFSLRVKLGKGKISPENCGWVCLGGPSVLEQLKENILANKPQDERPLGMSAPGWAAMACSMNQGESNIWTGQVEFKDTELSKSNVPISLLLLDDEGKPSNQLNFKVDLESGKASEVVQEDPPNESKVK